MLWHSLAGTRAAWWWGRAARKPWVVPILILDHEVRDQAGSRDILSIPLRQAPSSRERWDGMSFQSRW